MTHKSLQIVKKEHNFGISMKLHLKSIQMAFLYQYENKLGVQPPSLH